MKTIEERLDQLRETIQNEDFLWGNGLSNEINIRIFCYKPDEEMIVRHFVHQISIDQTLGCTLKIFNLYNIFLECCDDLKIIDAISEMEQDEGRNFLLEQLQMAIGPEQYVEKIQYSNHQRGRDVLMITGAGDVFPFMRVHSLLEALQPYFTDIPIIIMYPGNFDDHQLRLFEQLVPNNYYRAFNLF